MLSGYAHWSIPVASTDATPGPNEPPDSEEAWAPVSSEHALIAPPPAAAGAGAEGDVDDELAGLVDAAADAAALTEVDAGVDAAAGVAVDPGLAESVWVWVVDRFCVGEGVDSCELLLHAVAPNATTATVAMAARWLGRMIAPSFGPRPCVSVPRANPAPVTAL